VTTAHKMPNMECALYIVNEFQDPVNGPRRAREYLALSLVNSALERATAVSAVQISPPAIVVCSDQGHDPASRPGQDRHHPSHGVEYPRIRNRSSSVPLPPVPSLRVPMGLNKDAGVREVQTPGTVVAVDKSRILVQGIDG
jgi:hypothetical protein